MEKDLKSHWDGVYQTKALNEVSWYQPVPTTSLDLIENIRAAKNARIIDVGGGDSFLSDHLIELGYTDITVLDISEAAINRAKTRLGGKAQKIKWIVADVTEFKPGSGSYDIWHDRAAFHFLVEAEKKKAYVELVDSAVAKCGHLIIGTFSENGPNKCSGLDICQYSEANMVKLFSNTFDKENCSTVDHPTPFNTKQNFLFCTFKRR